MERFISPDTRLSWRSRPASAERSNGAIFPRPDVSLTILDRLGLVLLKFSGVEGRVTAKHAAEWSVVADWDPEKRYQAIGTLNPLEAEQMVKCVERLLKVL